MTVRSSPRHLRPPRPASDDVTIAADRLTKIYRVQKKPPGLIASLRAVFQRDYTDVRAVDGVSLTIRRGELVGFLGPNGAGKTTTLKMMAGLLEPTGGTVRVLGPRAVQARATRSSAGSRWCWARRISSGGICQPPSRSCSTRRSTASRMPTTSRTLDELTDLLDLRPLLDVQVRKLSLGERMKCELAAALLHKPDVLFLDEPTIGLDVVMQQKIREFIGAYQREHQATIILTSHYMDDVKALCERVVVIDQGRLIFDGALRELARRFGDAKLLTLDLDAPVAREALAEYGEVVSWEPTKVSLRVPRAAGLSDGRAAAGTLQVPRSGDPGARRRGRHPQPVQRQPVRTGRVTGAMRLYATRWSCGSRLSGRDPVPGRVVHLRPLRAAAADHDGCSSG